MCTAHHDTAQAKEEEYELLRNEANFLAVKSIIYNRTLFFNCLPLSDFTQRGKLINHNLGGNEEWTDVLTTGSRKIIMWTTQRTNLKKIPKQNKKGKHWIVFSYNLDSNMNSSANDINSCSFQR